ncbi:hypothetical protein [Methyloprofundus sp.]|uniref:hypothetical protein n=1 Tax=Methyloprofundus sp. TaxID=2020875 RepID=UPI003D13DD57
MYAAIQGTHENGEITLEEIPPTTKKSKVVIMFIEEKIENKLDQHKGVKIGGLAGKGYKIPDDFNEPLDDLNEYL